jgi:hypothetical protein
MTGAQLNECFGTGFSPVKSIKGFNAMALNKPAGDIVGGEADVYQQQHAADIMYDAKSGTLTIAASSAGQGLWIPYLGNGKGTPGAKGWGTYSDNVTKASWVATGPFSGCYVAAFSGKGGKRFAHLITPAGGYKAATVDNQIKAIKAATGSKLLGKWPMTGTGLGLAFFMNVGGAWCRRFAWVGPGGNLVQINAKSAPV